MWEKEEIVDTIEFSPVHLRGGGKVEHILEADGRFLPFVIAFANETGPHCIVKFKG
jgi:hypothetical protein